jgi:hypothetical protein
MARPWKMDRQDRHRDCRHRNTAASVGAFRPAAGGVAAAAMGPSVVISIAIAPALALLAAAIWWLWWRLPRNQVERLTIHLIGANLRNKHPFELRCCQEVPAHSRHGSHSRPANAAAPPHRRL